MGSIPTTSMLWAFQAAGKHLGHFCRLSIFGVSPNGGALVLGTSQCRFDSYHPDLVNAEQDYTTESMPSCLLFVTKCRRRLEAWQLIFNQT